MWAEPILHVDLDAFFVEAERLQDPGLIGKPVAVGGTGSRGVMQRLNEARVHGVRSAQPTATALRLCRDLIVVPPSHGRYGELSARVFEVFREFTPSVEGLRSMEPSSTYPGSVAISPHQLRLPSRFVG